MATASNPNAGMVIFNGRRYTAEDAKRLGIKVDKPTKEDKQKTADAAAQALADAAAVGNTPATDADATEPAKPAEDADEKQTEAKQVAAPPENKAVAAPKASTRRRS